MDRSSSHFTNASSDSGRLERIWVCGLGKYLSVDWVCIRHWDWWDESRLNWHWLRLACWLYDWWAHYGDRWSHWRFNWDGSWLLTWVRGTVILSSNRAFLTNGLGWVEKWLFWGAVFTVSSDGAEYLLCWAGKTGSFIVIPVLGKLTVHAFSSIVEG